MCISLGFTARAFCPFCLQFFSSFWKTSALSMVALSSLPNVFSFSHWMTMRMEPFPVTGVNHRMMKCLGSRLVLVPLVGGSVLQTAESVAVAIESCLDGALHSMT